MIVRPVAPADAAALAAIYAPYVRETAITFEVEAPDTAEFARRIAATSVRFPYLVAVDGAVAGYAYATTYRTRAAYDWVVETAIYVDRHAARRGIGRALYAALLDALGARGFIAAIGCLALPNAASVALHEALGFVHVGTQPGIGFKFGRWHDVGFWQRELAARTGKPGSPFSPP